MARTLQELVERCKASVHVDANQNRAFYQGLASYLDEQQDRSEIDAAEYDRMIQADTCFELQFYPETPVGFYRLYGVSLEDVIERAHVILDNQKGPA